MTLHRWRKSVQLDVPVAPVEQAAHVAGGVDSDPRIVDLRLENSRLRKLATDLLLEVMQLREGAPQTKQRAAQSERAWLPIYRQAAK
jgi:hypothetical protein